MDKLVPVPVDLSKLHLVVKNVVKNDVIKKSVYDKLVAKLNSIEISAFVLKTDNNRDKSVIETKISNNNGLLKKTDYKTKITD